MENQQPHKTLNFIPSVTQYEKKKNQNHIAGVISITNFSEDSVTLVAFTGHGNLTMSGSQFYCAAEIPELSVWYNTKIALGHMPECLESTETPPQYTTTKSSLY